MRLPLIPILSLLIISVFADAYILWACRRRFRSAAPARIQTWTALAMWAVLIVALFLPRRGGDNDILRAVMWMLFIFMSVYIPKFVFIIFDLLARIPQLLHRDRWKPVTWVGAAMAIITFVAMWWGALIDRNRIDVCEVDVAIAGLPASMDGMRLVQISDLHTGTWGTGNGFLQRLVDTVNTLDADAVLFTGDIVSQRSSELDPHMATLSQLQARQGVYAILGNHDYGDYSNWDSPAEKEASRAYLREAIRSMGWNLLLNQTAWLRSDSDSIALIGVENIGDPPFHIYGSLPKAYPTPGDSAVKILMTHNPAHWTDSIADHSDMNIPLTLSGHTHAMQIEVGGWSPAAWRYPTWGGLYADNDSTHQLYVNIGAGTVGFPARIGATPEITVITLRTKDSSVTPRL